MSNSFRIRNHSHLIKEKVTKQLAAIRHNYMHGRIGSEVEYKYLLRLALRDIYASIGKPSMRVRPATGLPVSKAYNDTMREVHEDLSSVFAEADMLSQALHHSFEQMEIDRQALNNRLKHVEDRLRISFALQQPVDKTYFRDSFINQDFCDFEMVDGERASVNPREAALTLSKTDSDEFKDDVRVTILNSSNGFPGNTHQVRAVGGILKFAGEENAHLDLNNMIDGNTDTWFEYEIYDISDAARQETSGYGFEYDEGISWLRQDDQPLRLDLQIELTEAKTLNWLSLVPFIPADKGATPPLITKLVIDDGKGNRQVINSGVETFGDEKIYMFSRQKCKFIHISLEQPTGYETWLGHIYFKEIQGEQLSFFEVAQHEGKRIDGPSPSVELLGLKYDPNTKSANQPVMRGQYQPPSQMAIVNGLFTPPQTASNVQANIEALSAWRYHIGLKDITSANYRFAVESTYISHPFRCIHPISEIELIVNEHTPVEFGDGAWVKYFISVDDGQSWSRITPLHNKEPDATYKYLINAGIPSEIRQANTGYIETLEPVREVRIKIEMVRPTDIVDAEYYSPIVKEYTLAITELKE